MTKLKVQTNEHDPQAIMCSIIYTHPRLLISNENKVPVFPEDDSIWCYNHLRHTTTEKYDNLIYCKKVTERTNSILNTVDRIYLTSIFIVQRLWVILRQDDMRGGNITSTDYDLKPIMYPAYGIYHRLCDINGNNNVDRTQRQLKYPSWSGLSYLRMWRFYFNDDRTTEYEMIDTRNASAVYTKINKIIIQWVLD